MERKDFLVQNNISTFYENKISSYQRKNLGFSSFQQKKNYKKKTNSTVMKQRSNMIVEEKQKIEIEEFRYSEDYIFKREWKELEISQSIQFRFSIISYNILAKYISQEKPELYPHCNEELHWDFRKNNLIHELQVLNGDVICLQEVDDYEFFVQELDKLGYEGTYKKRTSEYRDGCAIFWKKEMFQLVNSTPIEFNMKSQFEMEWLDRDNIALIVQLLHRKTNQFICVANTHILFNPKRGDIKLAQLKILLDTLTSIQTSAPNPISIFLSGDFNLTPNSLLYKYLDSGELFTLQNLNSRTLSGQTPKDFSYYIPPNIANLLKTEPNGNIKHYLNLASSYKVENERESVSTFLTDFLGLVDYIWYSKNTVQLGGILSLPTIQEVKAGILGKGIPSEKYFSDHLPLKVEFGILDFSKEKIEINLEDP